MTLFNLNYLLKILSLNVVTLGVRVSIYKVWGGTRHQASSPQSYPVRKVGEVSLVSSLAPCTVLFVRRYWILPYPGEALGLHLLAFLRFGV